MLAPNPIIALNRKKALCNFMYAPLIHEFQSLVAPAEELFGSRSPAAYQHGIKGKNLRFRVYPKAPKRVIGFLGEGLGFRG